MTAPGPDPAARDDRQRADDVLSGKRRIEDVLAEVRARADPAARPAEPPKEFMYLLNAFEQASQSDTPAKLGYGEKRKALLAYVAQLAAARAPGGAEGDAATLREELVNRVLGRAATRVQQIDDAVALVDAYGAAREAAGRADAEQRRAALEAALRTTVDDLVELGTTNRPDRMQRKLARQAVARVETALSSGGAPVDPAGRAQMAWERGADVIDRERLDLAERSMAAEQRCAALEAALRKAAGQLCSGCRRGDRIDGYGDGHITVIEGVPVPTACKAKEFRVLPADGVGAATPP